MNLSEINFDGLMLAEVRDNIDPKCEGRVKVFIPKIMFESEFGEKPVENIIPDVSNENILNQKFYNTEGLTTTNCIWIRPTQYIDDNIPSWLYKHRDVNGGSYRVPRINSKIFVFFLDGDPQKGYYLPFTPTASGDKLSSDNASPNWGKPEKQPLIDVIRSYWNTNRIEMDTNPDRNSFTIIITDDPNNAKGPQNPYRIHVECNANKTLIEVETINGNYVKIDDTDNINELTAYIKGNINITSDKDITLNAGGNLNINVGGIVNVS